MALIEYKKIAHLREERIAELKRLRVTGKKVVGYFCLYVPVEVIQASGAVPIRLVRGDNSAALLGERHLRPDACPFCKSTLGKLTTDPLYQLADALVFVNTCDMMRRLPEVVRNVVDIPVFQIYLPRTAEDFPNRLNEFLRQLEKMMNFLKTLTGVDGLPRLTSTITEYNRLRQALKALDETRIQEPPPVKGSEILDLVLLATLLKSEDVIELISEKMPHQPVNSQPALPRVLLAGSILTEEDRRTITLLEKELAIVADTICTGTRFFTETVEVKDDPLIALANYYFNLIPCAFRRPNDRLYDFTHKLIAERLVQGIIYKTLLYCDPWRFEVQTHRTKLQLPVLEIDSDYSEKNYQQLRTRIEAFAEMLKSK